MCTNEGRFAYERGTPARGGDARPSPRRSALWRSLVVGTALAGVLAVPCGVCGKQSSALAAGMPSYVRVDGGVGPAGPDESLEAGTPEASGQRQREMHTAVC